ncbi:hypothetical protein [Algoriphagus hitonicola]|uniref:hypothetical protein n=1 Tax=Algoriphagus hitonicola TaxID=435880 RepID=UPI00360AD2CA
MLIPNPGYPTYRSVTELLECHPMDYNLLENGEPDWEEIESRDLSKVKIMWVNYRICRRGLGEVKSL